jgi:hypothetical protein
VTRKWYSVVHLDETYLYYSFEGETLGYLLVCVV